MIGDCIKEFYENCGENNVYFNADHLLPIFTYIIAKSENYCLYTHCKMIDNFSVINTMKSISGYLLITL